MSERPSSPSLHALQPLGFSAFFADAWSRAACRLESEVEPARVTEQQRGALRLRTADGDLTARPSGRLRHLVRSALDLPAVGDWVAVRREGGVIEAVLPRASALVRQAAGLRVEPQVIAANVDTVAVVTSLDADFNARRLERYLQVVAPSGALPLVLLSKADACDDPEPFRERVHAAVPGVPCLVVSGLTGLGLDELHAAIPAGQTLALVGSSGVGKSTLLNGLARRELQATGEVRARDGRGRHVTTHRELFALPSGALVLDTPGMRELSAWVDGEAGAASDAASPAGFEELERIAEDCRFRDCRHEREPGCAIRAAVADGRLEEGRLENERKLEREMKRQALRQDLHAQAAVKRDRRTFSKELRRRPDKRQWG